MLKIRLSRAGKKAQPSYRVVVQEHTAPIKGKFVEQLGIYRPTDDPKVFTVDADRVKHWISVGAQPSDTVAVLLKKEGFDGMDKYIGDRTKQGKKKKEEEEETAAPTAAPAEGGDAAPAEEPKAEETPAEEKPAEEPKAEEAPAEEKPAEEPKAEEAPAEEPKAEAAPAEEKPAEEPKAEEAPAEEKPAEEPEAEEKPE